MFRSNIERDRNVRLYILVVSKDVSGYSNKTHSLFGALLYPTTGTNSVNMVK